MADMTHATGIAVPANAVVMQCGCRFQVAAIDRVQRVLRKDVLDVHQQQFLMLLLVLQAQLDPVHDFGGVLLWRMGQQLAHCPIDMLAEPVDVLYARARDQPALNPWERRAVGFIVGIEQVVVSRIQRLVAWQIRLEQKCLEKPADMRQVPFRRADVGHALDDVVFDLQRCTNCLTGGAYLLEALQQVIHVGQGRLLFRLLRQVTHGHPPDRCMERPKPRLLSDPKRGAKVSAACGWSPLPSYS